MQLIELHIEPGFYTEQTDRGAVRRWKDGDKIRFRYGLPEKLKGWVAYDDNDEDPIVVIAPVRAMHAWSSLDNQRWLALASDSKLYIVNNDTVYDITPIESQGTLTDPFTTVNLSNEVTVTHVDHDVEEGQIVIFENASAVGGITIDGEYVVDSVIDLDNYVIVAASAATSDATGGGSVSYTYEIPPPVGSTQFLGWGIGPYGLDNDPNYIGTGWGTPRHAINLEVEVPLWSLDNWGQDLMAARRGGPIYIWQRANGANSRATVIENSPAANNWIRVSPEDRHLISFGSHDGTQRDQSLVRWCAQEDYNDWTPSESNTAGDKRLDSGSKIVTAVRTRGETIIFTDQSIYSMFFVGPPDIFDFQPKGESLSIVSPNAAAESGGIIYFMAKDEFVVYDGVAKILPCTVRNHVFENLNRNQIQKVFAAVNKSESEVWWFYPAGASEENNRYVVFNFRENLWYYGTIDRTAYIGEGFKTVPIAVDSTGAVFLHETGYTANGGNLASFAETWDMEINDIGDNFAHVNKFIPDFLNLSGSVSVTFDCKQYPTSSAITKGPYTIDNTTRKVDFRARGRQIACRIDDVFGGSTPSWRFGTLRFQVTPDGRR